MLTATVLDAAEPLLLRMLDVVGVEAPLVPPSLAAVVEDDDEDEDEYEESDGEREEDEEYAQPTRGITSRLDDDDLDEEAQALLEALEAFESGPQRNFDPNQLRDRHGRWAKTLFGRVGEALDAWSKGEGPDDPLEPLGFTREQLRKVAVKRGIELRRGADEAEIRRALLDDVRVGAQSTLAEPKARASFTLKGGADGHEVAGTVRAEGHASGGQTRLRVIADGRGGYVGQRLHRGTREWRDDPSLGTGDTPKYVTEGMPQAQWRLLPAPPKAKGDPKLRDLDVGVYVENKAGSKIFLRREKDGKPGTILESFSDLDAMAAWADEHGETELAGWAAKERDGAKPAAAKAAKKAPGARPTSGLGVDPRDRRTPDADLVKAYRELRSSMLAESDHDWSHATDDDLKDLRVHMVADPRRDRLYDQSIAAVDAELAKRGIPAKAAPRKAAKKAAPKRADPHALAALIEDGHVDVEVVPDDAIPPAEQAARDRQVLIDKASAAHDTIAEVEQLLTDGASDRALKARITSRAAGLPAAGVAPETDLAAVREIEVENRIRAAYRAVRARQGGDWVSLADLRNELGEGTNRHEVDDALRRLERLPDVNIVPESNQKALTQADRDSAVRIGDQNKHAITIGDPSPRPVPGTTGQPAMRDRLLAAVGDEPAMRQVLADIRREEGLTPIGEAGGGARFDPTLHESIGGDIPAGAAVTVVRPGHQFGDVTFPARVETGEPPTRPEPSGRVALDATAVPTRTLSSDEVQSLGSYGLESHHNVNGGLRAGAGSTAAMRPKHQEMVADLDALLARTPTTQDIVVYRGVGGRDLTGNGFPIEGDPHDTSVDWTGRTWVDHGYSSTSATREGAKSRTSRLMLRVSVPAGTPAISNSELDPGEILLGRGLTYRVTADHGVTDGARRLDVEVIPSAPSVPTKATPAAKALTTKSVRADALQPGDRIYVRARRSDGELVPAGSGGRLVTVRRWEREPGTMAEMTIWATDDDGNEVIVTSTALPTKGAPGGLAVHDRIRVAIEAPTPDPRPAKKATPKVATSDISTSLVDAGDDASAISAILAPLRVLDAEARRDALDLRLKTDLQALLKSVGLPVSGTKRDLVDRLVAGLDGDATRSLSSEDQPQRDRALTPEARTSFLANLGGVQWTASSSAR